MGQPSKPSRGGKSRFKYIYEGCLESVARAFGGAQASVSLSICSLKPPLLV